jgi:uncharacterized protein (TIGR02271 family)
MREHTEADDWRDRTLVGNDGRKIGKVTELYLDHESGRPEWVTVNLGLFGTKSHFVPLAGAQADGEDVRVPVSKDQVSAAPSIDPDGELSEEEERRLFEHYGVRYTTEGSTTAQGGPDGARSGDDAMTRSEEELRVGTASQEAGRVRLRKHVVTEQVQQTVPVQREEVRLAREPITDENRDAALSGAQISEAEHEVVLHQEEPVVEKRTVPKERVRLDKDSVTEERQVSEEVRKERIESDAQEA